MAKDKGMKDEDMQKLLKDRLKGEEAYKKVSILIFESISSKIAIFVHVTQFSEFHHVFELFVYLCYLIQILYYYSGSIQRSHCQRIKILIRHLKDSMHWQSSEDLSKSERPKKRKHLKQKKLKTWRTLGLINISFKIT